MTDPIADLLTRIRNAALARHDRTEIPASRLKANVAKILKDEGYIADYSFATDDKQGVLSITLKWNNNECAIEDVQRVSKPGQRRYAGSKDIPKVRNGLGIMIVSTPRGMMTDRAARRHGVGGELICSVW